MSTRKFFDIYSFSFLSGQNVVLQLQALLSFIQFGLFYNLVDLIISVANIFISPNYIVTLLCNLAFLSLFLHFCVIFLRYSALKMYFCSEIYQRTLARLAYMTDIKDFFIASNTVRNAPDYDSNVLSTLIHTVEAFARVTYQSVYLIDYYRQEFLYVSDNPLFLCGHTAKEVKELGYSFYLKYVPEDEQKMLVELNRSGFKFFDTFDNVDKYQCSMSYHFHLKSGTKSKLINHQLTPILLTDEGKIWIGMCVVSLSSHKTVGHVEFHKNGLRNYWKYSFEGHRWKECDVI